MQFDFDTPVNRRGTNSLKWDVKENELPMWVADMDFKTAPAVINALERRVGHGVFGYSVVPEAWYEAIQNWWERRHDFFIEKDWLIFCTGVIPAVTCAVKRLTNHGDNVVLQTPVYDIFFHSAENTGRHVLESPLKYDGLAYEMDFEDLEEKLKDPLTTMMILCNPHNPVGKIWSKEELAKLGALCKKYHVVVLSDEIHCDLTDPGKKYTPFAVASEECRNNSVTCIAASKAFNMAGLQSAAVFVPKQGIREKVVRGLNTDEIAEPNAFAVDAVIAALNEGEPWLEELGIYLYENKRLVSAFLKENLPMLHLVDSDATYLLWIDCSGITENAADLAGCIRQETGLYLTAGGQYRGNGKYFLRMNVACPKAVVRDGLERLKTGIEAYNASEIPENA